MTDRAAKNFGAIESDYEFFMATSDESERDLDAYRPFVEGMTTANGVHMLDFGCGSGEFSEAFLHQGGWPQNQLTLSLVEPVESQRLHAAERLRRFNKLPIQQWPMMPKEPIEPLDLVLANHVFYYVSDLEESVRQLLASMATSGIFLIAMAGRTNALYPFWKLGFDMIGKAVPYHVSEDLEAAFEGLGQGYERHNVAYGMVFPDTTANRMKILRFLLAERLEAMEVGPLLELFEPWVQDGKIAMNTTCQHYVIQARNP
jgi:SAM-dependent methyltransferase